MRRLKRGASFPPLYARDIRGGAVAVPGTRRTHLQFRRFAGCPICNLHLQSFIRRRGELEGAGLALAVVFHSPPNELLPYQGNFPFAVIGDPRKELYRRYGVQSSLGAVLPPNVWSALTRGILEKKRPALNLAPAGGLLGLPADFLVSPDGRLEAVHYGRHANDQWTVDEVLALARQEK